MNYKQLLENRKKELEDNLESLKSSAKPVDLKEEIGRLTRMDALAQQHIALNNKTKVEQALLLLEQAFQRLTKDEYGICLNCEEEISEKRLKASPEAAFCLKCQK